MRLAHSLAGITLTFFGISLYLIPSDRDGYRRFFPVEKHAGTDDVKREYAKFSQKRTEALLACTQLSQTVQLLAATVTTGPAKHLVTTSPVLPSLPVVWMRTAAVSHGKVKASV